MNTFYLMSQRNMFRGFPVVSVVKNLPANARDTCLSLGSERSHMLQSD